MGSGVSRDHLISLPDVEGRMLILKCGIWKEIRSWTFYFIIKNFKVFKAITYEYEKLKEAGVSAEEMHLLLSSRVAKLNASINDPSTIARITSTKEDESRSPAETSSTPAAIVSNAKPPVKHTGIALLIDDSWVAVKVASKILQAFHFEVLTANSAKTGYEILEERYKEIKIIFLDVVMPKVDGVECLGWIKDNTDMSQIPIYMLSGLEDQTLSDVCIERGAEGMLIKPLSIPVVMGILQTHNLGHVFEDPKKNFFFFPYSFFRAFYYKILVFKSSFTKPISHQLNVSSRNG